MRVILVDWLAEVVEYFKFSTDTLFLIVFIIDKYLSHQQLHRTQLQLLGTAALLIASKYNEILLPTLADLVKLTKNAYDAEQIKQMEV